MKVKKMLPVLLLVVMAIISLTIRNCNNSRPDTTGRQIGKQNKKYSNRTNETTGAAQLDRTTTNLFFTKHAKCRMKCRHITQQEVKDILVNGTVNYNKSDLNDPRGPTYALEGITSDRQHVRIIFAPKQQHLIVVTVIDLDVEYECNCT